MPATISIENFRFDDAHLADRLEAEVKELKSKLRHEDSPKERRFLRDEIDDIEAILCRMCC